MIGKMLRSLIFKENKEYHRLRELIEETHEEAATSKLRHDASYMRLISKIWIETEDLKQRVTKLENSEAEKQDEILKEILKRRTGKHLLNVAAGLEKFNGLDKIH